MRCVTGLGYQPEPAGDGVAGLGGGGSDGGDGGDGEDGGPPQNLTIYSVKKCVFDNIYRASVSERRCL